MAMVEDDNYDFDVRPREQIIEEWYRKHYNKINSTGREDSITQRFLHNAIERNLPANLKKRNNLRILEVGANIGEHSHYVHENWHQYVATDLRLPEKRYLSTRTGKKIEFRVANVEELPFQNESFDRVIATCLLHHVTFPEIALQELRRVCRQNGGISLMLPHDPGFLYSILRKATSVRKARQNSIQSELELVHALEHRNHFKSIQTLLMNVFEQDSIRVIRYPFQINFYNGNAFSVYQIEKMTS